jgi:hypothetical protein
MAPDQEWQSQRIHRVKISNATVALEIRIFETLN